MWMILLQVKYDETEVLFKIFNNLSLQIIFDRCEGK